MAPAIVTLQPTVTLHPTGTSHPTGTPHPTGTSSPTDDALAWAGGRVQWWDDVQAGFAAVLTDAARPAAASTVVRLAG